MRCQICADKGILRIRYHTDPAVDYAICRCIRGQKYRTTIGRAVVGAWFPDGQVGLLEDFDDLEARPTIAVVPDVTEAGRGTRKRAKL